MKERDMIQQRKSGGGSKVQVKKRSLSTMILVANWWHSAMHVAVRWLLA